MRSQQILHGKISALATAPHVSQQCSERSLQRNCRRTNLRLFAQAEATSVEASIGFHQKRLSLQNNAVQNSEEPRIPVAVREAELDEELAAAAHLRATSFYAYPADRAFAGKIHQKQVRDEEFSALRRQRQNRRLALRENERSATLLAVCWLEEVSEIESQLQLQTEEGDLAVLGSLDVCAVKALPGEVLIGNSKNAAYLANVCTADPARRRGVGAALIVHARKLARDWGADGLFVHMMAVNEVARSFYAQQGFVVEKEESSNQAHYRGRCLDGVEGLGRSLLLRDTLL